MDITNEENISSSDIPTWNHYMDIQRETRKIWIFMFSTKKNLLQENNELNNHMV